VIPLLDDWHLAGRAGLQWIPPLQGRLCVGQTFQLAHGGRDLDAPFLERPFDGGVQLVGQRHSIGKRSGEYPHLEVQPVFAEAHEPLGLATRVDEGLHLEEHLGTEVSGTHALGDPARHFAAEIVGAANAIGRSVAEEEAARRVRVVAVVRGHDVEHHRLVPGHYLAAGAAHVLLLQAGLVGRVEHVEMHTLRAGGSVDLDRDRDEPERHGRGGNGASTGNRTESAVPG